MGMFDELNCDYPLPAGKQPHTPAPGDACYQTKDLGNGLDVYRITADGRLVFEKWGEWYDDKTGQEIKHTGRVSFYGGGDGMRDIFTATFVDGVVQQIVEGWGNEPDDCGPLTAEQIDEIASATLPVFGRLRFPPQGDYSPFSGRVPGRVECLALVRRAVRASDLGES